MYHDIGICEDEKYSFELRVEILPKELLAQEEALEDYVDKKIEEIATLMLKDI